MKFVYFFSAILIFSVNAVTAQLGFGPEVGLNGSKDMVRTAGVDKHAKTRFGMRIGGLADIALTDNLYLQPGLYYVSNGYKTNFNGGHDEYGINTVEIPINVVYKIGTPGNNRFFVGAGLFVAYNKDGYYHIFSPLFVDSKSDLRIGGGATDEIKHFDAGIGINAGYHVTEGLFFRVRSQMGIVNMSPQASSENSIKSFSFGVTVGYIFY